MEMIENEFNEDWVKIEDSKLIQKFNLCLEDTKDLSTYYIAEVPSLEETSNPHYVWDIHGGKNGNGNWIVYLLDIVNVIVNLKQIFNKVTILDIKNDVPDDVFDIRIICYDMK